MESNIGAAAGSARNEGSLTGAWAQFLGPELKLPYMQSLKSFLKEEKKQGKQIFPPGKDMFAALNHTPLENLKVVILGQDPYHGPGQAHGLCFSVPEGIKVPPSLVNIYKELATDTGFQIPQHGNLTSWAQQGVLLLNSVLSVQAGLAASHQGRGWEEFTDKVIQVVNECAGPTVFLLWGSYAQKKGRFVDTNKHLVLSAPHPSPLSAHRGFLGCRHFSQANQFLSAKGRDPIVWQV